MKYVSVSFQELTGTSCLFQLKDEPSQHTWCHAYVVPGPGLAPKLSGQLWVDAELCRRSSLAKAGRMTARVVIRAS